MAAGADDLVAAAPVFASLAEAVADCRWVLGCTARSRRIQLEPLHPRDAARRALAATASGPVALVFGRERTGLENDELQLCHAAIHIPSDPAFSSLNLAAAVQVLSYELRCAMLGDLPALQDSAQRTAPPAAGAASHAELEGLFGQLAEALEQIDFHKGRAPDSAMRKLRRLYLRANLDSADVRLLRGVLADTQRMARLAGSHLIGLLGAGPVTREDAVLSVRAGFRARELSDLWPNRENWILHEYPAGLFSHCFLAIRKVP